MVEDSSSFMLAPDSTDAPLSTANRGEPPLQLGDNQFVQNA